MFNSLQKIRQYYDKSQNINAEIQRYNKIRAWRKYYDRWMPLEIKIENYKGAKKTFRQRGFKLIRWQKLSKCKDDKNIFAIRRIQNR